MEIRFLGGKQLSELTESLAGEDQPEDEQRMQEALMAADSTLHYGRVRAMAVLLVDEDGDLVFGVAEYRGNLYRAALVEQLLNAADGLRAMGEEGLEDAENWGGSGGDDDEDDDD